MRPGRVFLILMKKILLLICTVFSVLSLDAQSSWTTYDTLNSDIESNFIWAVAFDEDDRKWVGVNGGNSCSYNDTAWTVYNLPSAQIGSNYCPVIAIGSDNTPWLGTYDGLWHLTSSGWQQHLGSVDIYALDFDSNGNLWAAADNGLRKFDGTTWTTYLTSNSGIASNILNTMMVDNANNIWCGHYFNGVSKFNGTSWINYTSSNSLLPFNNVLSFVQDAQGNIWIGLTQGGVARFNGTTWTIFNVSNSGLVQNRIHDMAVDASGNIWFAYAGNGGGVTKYDGTAWTTYNIFNSGLPNNFVVTIGVDSYNRKWFGTQGGGLAVFDDGIPLAAALLEFKGYVDVAHHTELSWKVASPADIVSYHVERSNDGLHFYTAGNIAGSKAKQDYTFRDNVILNGATYYRLQYENKNGKKANSTTIRLDAAGSSKTSDILYPNPAKDYITISVGSAGPAEVINISGQTVQHLKLQPGENRVDIRTLPAGRFQLITTAGSYPFIKK